MHVDLDQLESGKLKKKVPSFCIRKLSIKIYLVRPRHSLESTLKRITDIDLSDSSCYTRTFAICDGSDQEDDLEVRKNLNYLCLKLIFIIYILFFLESIKTRKIRIQNVKFKWSQKKNY
jgi:hypothetical protein